MNANSLRVKSLYDQLIYDLGILETSLRNEIKIVIDKGDDQRHDELYRELKIIRSFREQIQKIEVDWAAILPTQSPVETATEPETKTTIPTAIKIRDIPPNVHRKKEPGSKAGAHSTRFKKISVTLPDGRVIKKATNADTMVAVIQEIGIEKVKSLNIDSRGAKFVRQPLISDTPIEGETPHQIGKYYIFTHGDTGNKVDVLVMIKDRLGIDLGITLE